MKKIRMAAAVVLAMAAMLITAPAASAATSVTVLNSAADVIKVRVDGAAPQSNAVVVAYAKATNKYEVLEKVADKTYESKVPSSGDYYVGYAVKKATGVYAFSTGFATTSAAVAVNVTATTVNNGTTELKWTNNAGIPKEAGGRTQLVFFQEIGGNGENDELTGVDVSTQLDPAYAGLMLPNTGNEYCAWVTVSYKGETSPYNKVCGIYGQA